ncbi:MAG: CusA/CzcA family heavy metal efflux RND transporter, partial [Syntrophothermus sp.]
LSLTYVPMASALFLSRKDKTRNHSEKIMKGIQKVFDPVILYALAHKKIVTGSALLLFVLSILVFNRLGGEFIPQLEEGDLAAGVMTLQGGSLSNTVEKVKMANKILLENFPEVKHAVCKIGAGEIPTDPTPMETGDYIITLKPKNEWTSAKTREELVAKMEEKLVVLAGVKFEFQQPIQMRFNELLSGSKQDIAVKIFGDDLEILAEKAAMAEEIIRKVDGVTDLNVEKVTGLGQVQVDFDRDRLAQYGLSVTDVNRVLRAAFAGSQAGVVYDEEKRFGMVVRLDKDYRQSLEDVKNLWVALPGGGQIPIVQVASIRIKSGPAQVSREDTRRRITVGFNVRNRDVQSVISEVSSRLSKQVQLPTGYYISYGGQFQNLQEARNRLAVAVPVALLLIFVLLYFSFHSVKQTLLIFSAVPFAAIGGIFALWLRGMNFSISAGVGFIALFGVAVLNGIVLISEFNNLEKEGITDVQERVLKGLKIRLRPVIMTAAVASLGFLPMALSTSPGAEVQKPLATVVIGGLITATLLTLVILPVFYIVFSTRSFRKIFKMKRMLLLLMLAASCLFPAGLFSQNPRPIDLRSAISIALDSNLSLHSSKHYMDAEKAAKGTAWDLPKTAFSGEYGHINSPETDNSYSITQEFAFPTLYISQGKFLGAKLKNSQMEYRSSELEIATKVKQVYWQMVYLESLERLKEYQDSLYTGFLKAARLRAGTGETNRLEMITAQSHSLEVRNELRQVRADIIIYSEKLSNLLNTVQTYKPADTILIKKGFNESSGSLAVSSNPVFNSVLQKAEISRWEKKTAINRIFPDLSIGYFSQTLHWAGESPGYANNKRFNGFQAGISMPLWFVPYTSRAKEAGLREKAAREYADYYLKSLQGDYKVLAGELEKYRNSIIYYENQALPEADNIIRQATLTYKSGEMDYMEYVQSLNQALNIKQNYLEVLNNCNQTIISLESITGKIF